MGTVLILTFILLVGPLALCFGVDSRPLDANRRGRRWI
jgi:hypothetical protein